MQHKKLAPSVKKKTRTYDVHVKQPIKLCILTLAMNSVVIWTLSRDPQKFFWISEVLTRVISEVLQIHYIHCDLCCLTAGAHPCLSVIQCFKRVAWQTVPWPIRSQNFVVWHVLSICEGPSYLLWCERLLVLKRKRM